MLMRDDKFCIEPPLCVERSWLYPLERFLLLKMIYLGGWVSRQDFAPLKWSRDLALWGIFPSTTLYFDFEWHVRVMQILPKRFSWPFWCIGKGLLLLLSLLLLLLLVHGGCTFGVHKCIIVASCTRWVHKNVLLSYVYDRCTIGALTYE